MDQDNQEPREPLRWDAGGVRRSTVVIVDEDEVFLELVDMLLSTHGYTTFPCKRVTEAYAMIRNVQPSLVILGIRQGVEDPVWTVLDLIRLGPATTHIPVLLSSIDAEFLKEKAAYFDMLGIASIEKPFRLNDLLMKVERAIGPPAAQ